MPKYLTTSDFIIRAKNIHGTFFDYSKVVYINMHTKVNIIDPEYGEFWQTPMGHLQGQGHPSRGYVKMAEKRRKSIEDFIKEARNIHGNLYDYSKVEYTHCDSKVCIIDPEYGEFWQTPYQHLNSHGCPARTKEKRWEIHIDHVIPLSIIHTSNRSSNKWYKERPLYKFLNSDINLKSVKAKHNIEKSDYVTINGKSVVAGSVRNNYRIISYLISTLLKIDPTNIIEQDKKFIEDYFGI